MYRSSWFLINYFSPKTIYLKSLNFIILTYLEVLEDFSNANFQFILVFFDQIEIQFYSSKLHNNL